MTALRPDQVRVILVAPCGDANVGAAARALAAFGAEDLVLVNPRRPPGRVARNWACQGRGVLERCRMVENLEAALEGTNLAAALTRRGGKRRHRLVSAAEFAEEVLPRYLPGRVALVFGTEESGLSNQEMLLCHRRVGIPTHPRSGSLNLAHAVTVTLYELLGRGRRISSGRPPQPAPPELRARMVAEIGRRLEALGYPGHQATLQEEMVKLADILERARLERWEINFLLGIFRHIERRLQQG